MRPFSIDELVGGSHEKALRILAMMRILSKAPTALTRWGSTMLRSTLAIPLRSTRKWARPTCTTVMPPRSHRHRQTQFVDPDADPRRRSVAAVDEQAGSDGW